MHCIHTELTFPARLLDQGGGPGGRRSPGLRSQSNPIKFVRDPIQRHSSWNST